MILRMIQKIGDDRVRAHSAESAFFIIMSIFPVLMLLLTMIQFTPMTVEILIQAIQDLIPVEIEFKESIQSMLEAFFDRSAALVPGTIIAALWTAGKGILGLSDGLNAINKITETKNYFVTRFRCAFYTVVLLMVLTLSVGILFFGYGIEDYLKGLFPEITGLKDKLVVLPTGISLILLVLLFAVMYAFLPNRRLNFFRQLPGAVFTSLSWAVFSYTFSIYLKFSSSNMSILYGSLTTLVVVMLWLYFFMYLFFIGAEINLYLEDPDSFGM